MEAEVKKDRAVIYAAPWCPKCRKVAAMLEAVGVEVSLLYPERDDALSDKLAELTNGEMTVPTLVYGTQVLIDPQREEIEKLLDVKIPQELEAYDVAIIGGGPAGLTAAIYCARENFRTIVIEKAFPGGQAALTAEIENYPGFPDPVSGADLMERVYRQATSFGAEVVTGVSVEELSTEGKLTVIKTDSGEYRACTVIICTGAVYRRLGVPGEEKLTGRGVSFCATCDAPFFRGKPVVVVGGGNSALQETIHLADFTRDITLIQLLDHFTASPVLQSRIESMDSIKVLLAHEVVEVLGESGVEGVMVKDRKSGETRRIDCEGVFLFIGQVPVTDFLKGFLDLDKNGFVVTDPATLSTSVPSVFAAGDVRAGSSKQITAAVGEGTVASFMLRDYLEKKRRA